MLRTSVGLEWVHVWHEETAAFAAAAEARMSGRLAVCAGSCGPGNTHLVNGLFDAHRSRVPVLAIAAQIPSAEIGTDYSQETHPERPFGECSHCCELVSSPNQLPRTLEIAIRTAVGQRGVAVVVIPGDLLMMAAENLAAMAPAAALLPPPPVMRPRDAELDALARLLNEAKAVTLLCGRGCAHAHPELMQLAEALKSPHRARAGRQGARRMGYRNPLPQERSRRQQRAAVRGGKRKRRAHIPGHRAGWLGHFCPYAGVEVFIMAGA